MYTFIMQAAAPEGGFQWSSIFFFVALFVIMWLFMIRPQQKRQKEVERRRSELQKGSSVVTAGGIHGKIKEINDTDFLIEIAEGVRIRVEKTSVYAVAEDKTR